MFKYFGVLLLVLLLSSCMTAESEKRLQELTAPGSAEDLSRLQQEKEQRELRQQVLGRVESIRRQIVEGKLAAAEESLQPLKTLPDYSREVENLQALIDLARDQQRKQPDRDLSRNRMLAEVEDHLQLPESYGQVAVIDSSLAPVVLPPGKMEELCNRRISVNMDSVGISELVDVLSQEGLNVVADEALQQEDKVLTVRVNDIPLKDLFSYFARNMGIAFHIGNDLVWITAGEEKGGPPLETRIIRLRQGMIPKVPSGSAVPGSELGALATPADEEDNDLEEALTTFFASSPEGAAFRIFRNRNILMIRDTRENLRLVENIVQELDHPPYQVVIEAKFLTVSQDDLKDMGVEMKQKLTSTRERVRQQLVTDRANTTERWLDENGNLVHSMETEDIVRDAAGNPIFQNVYEQVASALVKEYDPRGPNAAKETNLLTSLGALAANAESGVGFLQLNGVLGRRAFDIAISALESKNSSTILSAPKVTVMNNRTARIRKGNTLKYFEEFDIETIDAGDNSGTKYALVPTGTPTDLLLGITFDVRVNVGNDGRTVLLGLNPQIVEFLQWEYYATGDSTNVKLPYTYDQNVVTTVGVSSGQTVVLGGMLENTKTKQLKKVPFLGDLPLIGFFFRHTTEISIPTNLLIFVTAHVVNSRGEYLDVRLTGQQPDEQPAEQPSSGQ